MSYYDILLAKQLSGGGGGDITVESLPVTANGTYSAPSGKAYSPVVANVPNSYTASDEGKVVSSGALVAQTSQTIDTNGTYDTTLKNEVVVNVSGGGGGPSNIVSGTFTGTTAGNMEIEVPYSGTGYPIAFVVISKGGAKADIGSQTNNIQAIVGFKSFIGDPSGTGTAKYFAGSYVSNNYGSLEIYSFNNTAIGYMNGTTYGVGFKDATHFTVNIKNGTGQGFVIGKEFCYSIIYYAE